MSGTALRPLQSIEQLQQQRMHLLRSGTWLKRDGCVDKSFQGQHNRIVDEIRKLKAASRHDPLKYFPVEVWSLIIEEAATVHGTNNLEYFSNFCHYVDTDRLLELSGISTHWRRMVMGMPELWSHLRIDDNEVMTGRLLLAIRLSGNYLPLHLHLVVPLSNWAKIASILQAKQERITSITMWNLSSFKDSPRSLMEAVQSFSCLPNLERVGWSDEGLAASRKQKSLTSEELARKSKNIRYLCRVFAEEQILRLPQVSQLRQVMLFDAPLKLFPHIIGLKDLREVAFRGFILDNREICYLHDEDEADIPTTEPGQLRWRCLNYSCSPCYFSITLAKRVAETLEELSFTMHLWMTPRFLSLLRTLERLKKLCIKIYLQYRDAEFTYPLASRPSNIQSLTLKVSDARVEQQKASHEEKLKYLHPLAVSLPSHMSNVAELSLETYDVPLAFAATFLGRMESASNLTISCNSRESYFDASTFKQQLSVEKVIFDAPSSMLDMIQSQLLTDLHVSVNTNSQASRFLLVDNPQYFSRLSSSLMQKLFLTNEWPNLQFLHLEASLCNWTNVSHPSLTRLRLRATHNDKRDYITHFCQQLALNPLNFPSLRELELDWYPQWDILFLMLERRNFQYEDSTFSNIEVLVLPSLTSPSILEPIRLLVQGKITERPSNYEASVTSLYSVISDEKRLGCLACLYARQPCTQIRELPQPGMDEQAPSEVREYVYPTTHDDILQDWDRRDQEAMDIIRGSRMQGKCNKVAHDTSITIS